MDWGDQIDRQHISLVSSIIRVLSLPWGTNDNSVASPSHFNHSGHQCFSAFTLPFNGLDSVMFETGVLVGIQEKTNPTRNRWLGGCQLSTHGVFNVRYALTHQKKRQFEVSRLPGSKQLDRRRDSEWPRGENDEDEAAMVFPFGD